MSTPNWYDDSERSALCRTQPMEERQAFYERLLQQEREELATLIAPAFYVNVFDNRGRLEAHDGVWTNRADAVDAAEQYADSYRFTLTDAGKIDLTEEFSEGFHEKRDFDAAVDRHIDELRDISSFTLAARA
jgi:hypothetical protein